jgi:hypothetical protein
MPAAVRIWGSNRIWYMVPERQYGPMVRVETDRPDGGRTHQFVQRTLVTELAQARHTDPDTSIEAASRQTVDKVRTEHRVVLELPIKQTSIGVRRGELVRLGLVADSGRKGLSDTGTRCIKWQITKSGRQTVAA